VRRNLALVGKRVVQLVPQLLAISLATFLLIRLLPGDPARALLGPHATSEGVASLSERMGLNESLPTQYWIYLKGVLHGDLGFSWFTGQNVATDLAHRVPATLELVVYALIIAVVVGVGIGAFAAIRGNRGMAVRGLTLYTRFAGALPDFWMALLGIFVFFYVLHLAPAPLGRIGLTVAPPKTITGFYTIDGILTGNLAAAKDAAAHLALPVLVLGLIVAPMVARVTNVSMSDALRSEYIRYARASGLKKSMIYRYAIRNALPPVVTIGGVMFVYLLGGAVLIEKVFSWGGVGQYAVQAVGNSDYAAIQGFVLLAAAFTVLVYLVVDLIQMALDPRVTH
jgi:ABC-type dipeptide/oligopeptide/nickel transport system permease component